MGLEKGEAVELAVKKENKPHRGKTEGLKAKLTALRQNVIFLQLSH